MVYIYLYMCSSLKRFHYFFLAGVVKTLYVETLKHRLPGSNRGDAKLRASAIKQALCSVKYPSEFRRRAREEVDVSNVKAGEWRNRAMFCFKSIGDQFPEGSLPRKMWIMTAYVLLLNMIEEEDYAAACEKLPEGTTLGGLYLSWMEGFQAMCGLHKMTHNPHLMAHMEQIRKMGPLYLHATFTQESSYGVMQKRFEPGTTHIGIQLVRNFLFAEMVLGHRDERKLKIDAKTRPKADDSMCFLSDGDFAKVVEVVREEDPPVFMVQRVETEAYCPPEMEGYDFGSVGVEKVVSFRERVEEIRQADSEVKIVGKAICPDGKIVIRIPRGVFFEEI